jgi:hypothetical protein
VDLQEQHVRVRALQLYGQVLVLALDGRQVLFGLGQVRFGGLELLPGLIQVTAGLGELLLRRAVSRPKTLLAIWRPTLRLIRLALRRSTRPTIRRETILIEPGAG